jgi:glucosamine-6-phosphate deaminase
MIPTSNSRPASSKRVPLAIFADSTTASVAVAQKIASLIRARQREGRSAVLGLATGSTVTDLYAELVRLHREEELRFADVVTFNLDEYHPLPASHPQSFRHFMRTHLFDHVDIPAQNTHLPDGSTPPEAVDAHCVEYEKMIRATGGIDLQILGIGRNGHIGFNEPGSPRDSRTRLVILDAVTRHAAAHHFHGEEHTPQMALTMGIATILAARRIVLLAWGAHKAASVRDAVEGPVTATLPASFLQEHDNALFVLDQAAAGALSQRIARPENSR